MILLIALFLITLKAIPDALYDRGYKTLSKYIRFFYDAVFAFSVFALATNYFNFHGTDDNLWWVIAGFVLVRWALFDLVYNLLKKNPVFYLGTTDPIDKLFGWFFCKTGIDHNHFLAMFKFIALCFGISWLV